MENAQKKQDRRVIKTKRAIRNAFAELLSVKSINEITVTDIAEIADINRKTFYNYYSGAYQIIDEIENEIVSAFDEALKTADFKKAIKDPYFFLEKLTAIINSDMDFYEHLLKADENVSLISKIIALLKIKIKDSFSSQLDVSPNSLDILANYTVSGMIAVYQSWFNSERTISLEEIARTVSVICFNGVAGIVGMI